MGKKRKRKKKERTYKEKERSFVRIRCEGGLVAEAWTLMGGATAFDAELSAVARAIEVSVYGATPGTHVRVFTDSQATMRRVLNDSPGPGQQDAVRCILGARRLCQREAMVSIHWVPGHSGIIGVRLGRLLRTLCGQYKILRGSSSRRELNLGLG